MSGSLAGPLLLIFQGPHGYVSTSWYATRDLSPTWNHLTLHVRGTPEVFDHPHEVLTRTVDHMQRPVQRPWRLAEMPDDGHGMADEVLGFRLRARWWHAEAKPSQDKPPERRTDVRRGLEAPGPYRNPSLAEAMDAMAP